MFLAVPAVFKGTMHVFHDPAGDPIETRSVEGDLFSGQLNGGTVTSFTLRTLKEAQIFPIGSYIPMSPRTKTQTIFARYASRLWTWSRMDLAVNPLGLLHTPATIASRFGGPVLSS